MTDDETVERVARAIYETASGPWEFASNYGKELLRREARAALSALPRADDALEGLRELSERATKGEWSALGGVLLGPSGPETDYDPMVIGAFKAGKGLVAGISYAVYSVPTKTEGVANVDLAAAAVNYVRARLAQAGEM